MTRGRLGALLAVLALVAGALVLGGRGGSQAAPDDGLSRLRAEASLAPCPAALAPDLPDVALPCLGGGPNVRVSGAPAGPLLVNVWGTWCPPCVDEAPLLIAFDQRAQGRVGVVGVLTSDTEDSALTFARTFGMHYPQVVDDDGLVRSRYGTGAPLTLFVDAAGTVTHVQSGAFRSAEQLDALVAEHLGVAL